MDRSVHFVQEEISLIEEYSTSPAYEESVEE